MIKHAWTTVLSAAFVFTLVGGTFAADEDGDKPKSEQPADRPQRPNRARIIALLKASDKNKDGKITRSESPPRLKRFFDRIDANKDDVIDQAELKRVEQRFNRGRPGGDARGGGVDAGKPAPDFTLKTLDGKQQVKLSSFAGKLPVALVFGSYT